MIKILFFQFLAVLLISYSCKSNPRMINPHLIEENFKQLPEENKPWTFWYWISDNVSKEGISKDLEAMAKAGIGLAAIGCIGDKSVEKGDVPTFSDEWWDLVHWAIKEGKRTGVDIGFFNCPGWATSGGPWVKPDQTMRHLTLSEKIVKGPSKISLTLEKPVKPFQDVAVIAFPRPRGENNCLSQLKHTLTSSPKIDHLSYMTDGKLNTEVLFPKYAEEVTIFIKTEKPLLANSLLLFPAELRINAECQLYIKENGEYRNVKTFLVDRSNYNLFVGPVPYAPICVSLGGVRSDDFKLVFNLRKGHSLYRINPGRHQRSGDY